VRDVEGAEWLIVAIVVLVLFGGSQIPKLARSLGTAKKEFERGLRDEPEQPAEDSSDEDTPVTPKAPEA
jgi:sec-independent protein translocase protein TatA